jgi:Protein of unknown function (DUF3631)
MTTEAKLERLKIVDDQLALAGLPADKRRKLAEERERILADPEMSAGYRPPPPDGIDFSAIPPAEGYDTLGDYAAEVARLAALPPHEYDRCRREEAQRLGVRAPTLDKDVQRARPRDGAGEGQGEAITFEEPEPWPEPVAGAVLLDELVAFLGDHLALRPHDGAKIALWVLLTYCFEAFFISPRLAITSATKRCGKSTLIDILAALSSRAITADSLTVASTFRVVAASKPTLLIDEADTFLKENEELRGILNSGHKATGSVIRAVEVDGEWTPRKFRTFSPCAIAMIGRLPGTLEDRSVHVLMKRAMRGEVKRSFRPDRAGDLDKLRSQAARFAVDHMTALAIAEPELPPGAFNRFADNWRPLAAVADLAGGRWPALARAAILADLGEADDDELGQQLLEDVRTIFAELTDDDGHKPARQLPSKIICTALHEMADRPWRELGRNETAITQNKLARMLKPFAIAPTGSIRLALGGTSKGYKREAFIEAWNRYLSPEGANQTGTTAQATESAEHSLFSTGTNGADVPVGKRKKPRHSAGCAGMPVENGGLARETKNRGPRSGTAATFAPSAEWRDVPPGAVLPPGLEIEMDMTTGQQRARTKPAEDWLDDPAEQHSWGAEDA